LVDFETLSPDGMVKLIDPDTSFEEVAENLIGAAAGPESGDTTPVP